MRALILEHVLPLVPFDGWSDYTLSQAAARAKISAQELRRAFPAGPIDCIDYFFAREDEALAAAFPGNVLAKLRMPERIQTLILARLESLKPHKEAVRRAVARRALPWNGARSCRSLYHTVDMMWRLADDASTDFSFYTKRATLATLYGATLLYWLNDSSEHIEQTKEFLTRGLGAIAAFGKRKQSVKKRLGLA